MAGVEVAVGHDGVKRHQLTCSVHVLNVYNIPMPLAMLLCAPHHTVVVWMASRQGGDVHVSIIGHCHGATDDCAEHGCCDPFNGGR